MVQLRMQSLQQSLVKQGILRKDQPQDEKLRKIFECLKCRNTIRPNDFPSPHVLKPVYRNADNSMGTKGDDLADEKNERYPKAVVHETVTNNTKMINGQRITVILHNKTIIENNNGQGGKFSSECFFFKVNFDVINITHECFNRGKQRDSENGKNNHVCNTSAHNRKHKAIFTCRGRPTTDRSGVLLHDSSNYGGHPQYGSL